MRRIAVLGLLLIAGCGGGGEKVKGPPPAAPKRIELSSPAITGNLPKRFTCDGDKVSPPLRWSGVPAGARELSLLLEDPDAPGGTFVHWVVLRIPARTRAVLEGGPPAGTVEAKQSFGKTGYGPPCPPKGDSPHRDVFTLYALRRRLGLGADASPEEVRSAIGKAALARGTFTARYGR